MQHPLDGFPSRIGHCILLYPRSLLFLSLLVHSRPDNFSLSLSPGLAMPLHFLPIPARHSLSSSFPRFGETSPPIRGTTTTTMATYTTSHLCDPSTSRSCQFALPSRSPPFSLDHTLTGLVRSPVLPRAVLPVSRIASSCNALVCAICIGFSLGQERKRHCRPTCPRLARNDDFRGCVGDATCTARALLSCI